MKHTNNNRYTPYPSKGKREIQQDKTRQVWGYSLVDRKQNINRTEGDREPAPITTSTSSSSKSSLSAENGHGCILLIRHHNTAHRPEPRAGSGGKRDWQTIVFRNRRRQKSADTLAPMPRVSELRCAQNDRRQTMIAD